MEYSFSSIEQKWQQHWKETGAYKVPSTSDKPKYYVLDMFPYPSGAGLHVGHPLGYIASDIYSRYKRLQGYNVLHPMGYDAFGLPAEQYAIEHGVHPAVSTDQNIANFRKQLDKIGFCFDWDREVKTSDPSYYKWTQWIFLQLFKSFYNRQSGKAEPIDSLVKIFETEGNTNHPVPNASFAIQRFPAGEWTAFPEKVQQDILMEYRLAYCGIGEVNWCEALGTVLANDEVVNGVSERGGHPVIRKKLRQWYLRITEYADRLLEGLNTIEFSDSMKEMQSNWIGKSYGANITFSIANQVEKLEVYTTRPDTIFGVDFMVIAPEHDLVRLITSEAQEGEVDQYLAYVNSRSERERQAEKKITGCFTGAYAINPFDNREIPIWISEYVLAGYGTGAIMAVPCGDERDFRFANHFNIPITNILGDAFDGKEANPTKDAVLYNSDFLNGVVMRHAGDVVIDKLEAMEIGRRKTNYKMRDAAFSRQRYWGEPFPIVWKDGVAYPLDESELPLELPFVEKYGPGPEGEGPLANVKEWINLIPDPSPAEKGAPAGNADELKDGKISSGGSKYKVNSPAQFELARKNRKEYTEAEGILWEALRNNKLGYKFRRQHPIDSYIVDFFCYQKALAIEVDGGYHDSAEQQAYDAERTKALGDNGLKVIRFSNSQVINDLGGTIEQIKAALKNQINTEAPLAFQGEGSGVRESSTMPGYAGSSWYFLRYMDPHNDQAFASRQATDYWNQVDLYVGGTEHAVGHLLYSRLWTKILFDLGYIGFEEPFKKLLNQGMIQGSSRFVYRIKNTNQFVSYGQKDGYDVQTLHVDVNLVDGYELDVEAFKKWRPEYADAEFVFEDGTISFSCNLGNQQLKYICGSEVEKMSKSKFNTVNPDILVEKYGADTFRMYEMFLGPVEQSKPWDTKGIEGVHRFLKKLWRLFYDEQKGLVINNDPATPPELKVLHRTIKKLEDDTERYSFNTAVSGFMIAVNELSDLNCHKKEILEPLLVLLTPYAPHIAEELYHALGHTTSVLDAKWPVFDASKVTESSKEYPVSVNGKLRTTMTVSLDATQPQVESMILENEIVQKWIEGKPIKKFIFVKGRMINVVV